MISEEDVRKLAGLARVALTDEEVKKMQSEISSIIAYVDVIQKVELPATPDPSPYLEIENVLREDENPHESGMYTKDLVEQFPKKDGDFLEVKKILP